MIEVRTRLTRIRDALINHVKEVQNDTGGVIGYTINLDIETTRRVFEIIEGHDLVAKLPPDILTSPMPFPDWLDYAEKLIQEAFDASTEEMLTMWRADYKKILEQRDAWKAAFDEVEGQRNSLVKENENLRNAVTEHLVAEQDRKFVSDCGIFCDCGHPRGRHMGDGQCLMFGCDCIGMRQWHLR